MLEDAATEYLKKDFHCMIRFRIAHVFKLSHFVRMDRKRRAHSPVFSRSKRKSATKPNLRLTDSETKWGKNLGKSALWLARAKQNSRRQGNA